jgi:N-acetylmuramoyl-L-alanine amidase
MKRVVFISLLLWIWGLPHLAMAAGPVNTLPIQIQLDQTVIHSDVSPIIHKDRTLVPIRVVSENLGALVFWNAQDKSVTIRKAELTLVLQMGHLSFLANDQVLHMDVSPTIHEGRTMVPLRFISEQLGLQVGWDSATRTVSLKSPPPPAPPEEPMSAEPEIPSAAVTGLSMYQNQISIQTDREGLQPTIFFLDNPRRAVIDLVYSVPNDLGTVLPLESPLVSEVRYSHFNNAPDTTRIVLDLTDRVDITTEIQGTTLLLTLKPHIYKVVIDAGHGGKDPGAISANGTREKDFALDLTLRVGQLLMNHPRIQVIYTRSDDTYPTLEERVKLANEINADVFISIHANKFSRTTVRGIETYYSREDSKELASLIHSTLLPITGFPDRGTKQANFHVIKNTVMPAALLEIGFLSNPEEEAQLNNSEFRQKVAEGIRGALLQFFGLTEVTPS